MKKAKFGFGLIIGAIAGVVAGLLTAPKSGKETRADLKHKKEEVQSDANAKIDEARGKARAVADDAKIRVNKAADEAKAKADDLKARTTRAAESAKEAFNEEETSKKKSSKE
jgi:gas vesicle protein